MPTCATSDACSIDTGITDRSTAIFGQGCVHTRTNFDLETAGRIATFALDLCLACKACKSECPVSVDMATYKAELAAIASFAAERHLRTSQFTAIGALSRVVVAYFDWETKEYLSARNVTLSRAAGKSS